MELLGMLVGILFTGCVGGGTGVFVNRHRGLDGGFMTGFVVGCVLSIISLLL